MSCLSVVFKLQITWKLIQYTYNLGLLTYRLICLQSPLEFNLKRVPRFRTCLDLTTVHKYLLMESKIRKMLPRPIPCRTLFNNSKETICFGPFLDKNGSNFTFVSFGFNFQGQMFRTFLRPFSRYINVNKINY